MNSFAAITPYSFRIIGRNHWSKLRDVKHAPAITGYDSHSYHRTLQCKNNWTFYFSTSNISILPAGAIGFESIHTFGRSNSAVFKRSTTRQYLLPCQKCVKDPRTRTRTNVCRIPQHWIWHARRLPSDGFFTKMDFLNFHIPKKSIKSDLAFR
jgi:hypothetical protein